MANELQIIDERIVLNKAFRIYGTFETPLFLAKDIAIWIDYDSNHISELLDLIDDSEKSKITFKSNKDNVVNGEQKRNLPPISKWFVTEKGLKLILQKTLKPKAKDLALLLNLDLNILKSPIEADCTRILQESFFHLNPISQFYINGFRIDLYFPKERIAIECDEHGHYEYEEEKDIQRQDFITKSLGCQFIRFNPNQKGFNIGTVINKIIKTVETLTGEEKNEFN